ncbi:ThiF family adenylyltransferase, partial [Raoultella planticola]|nr:ThiF family adenylyltransferase [Raoultella planticola]
DIGKNKALCARDALLLRNPECIIDAYSQTLSASMLNSVVHDCDLVVDAADNFAITYPLSDACHLHNLPLILASVLGRYGYVGGFCGQVPSYRAVFPLLPKASGNCNTAGVMGPAVATIGALQAQMTLSVLLKLTPSPLGCMVSCDLARWRFSQFSFYDAAEPENQVVPFIDCMMLQIEDHIVELRSKEEAPESVVDSAERILLRDLGNWEPPVNRRIVLVCTSGIRAAQAARMLELRGFTRLAIIADNHGGS